MNAGPFSNEKSAKLIALFIGTELIPLVVQLQELASSCTSLRIGLMDSFTKSKLKSYEENYLKLSQQFMNLYKKWFNADLLFKDLGATDKEMFLIMSDYVLGKKMAQEHFDEAFRLIAYIDRTLSNQATIAYNRVTTVLAILAITISLITVVIQK